MRKQYLHLVTRYIDIHTVYIYVYIYVYENTVYMYISVHGITIYIYLQYIYLITKIVNYLQDSRTWTVSGRPSQWKWLLTHGVPDTCWGCMCTHENSMWTHARLSCVSKHHVSAACVRNACVHMLKIMCTHAKNHHVYTWKIPCVHMHS